jgi:predicted Ser/Thr protein kinase
MNSNPQNCPRCGTVLAGSVAGTLCPRCMGAFLMESTAEDVANGVEAPAGVRIGDFELGEELGRGAMGVVYRARQAGLNRDVALKVVLAGQFAGDSERKRFEAEAAAAARLDHPNIVPIYAVGEHDGRQYYAMRLVEGRSLASLTGRAWEPRRAAAFVATLAHAVHHAHQRGVLHRDLKPANILVDEAGEPHITDFGLARRLDDGGGLTVTGSPLGTPAYMAPEQASTDGAATIAADVYALGAILYELLAGRTPFLASSLPAMLRKIAEEEPAALPVAVPRDLATVVGKCLRKSPPQRYASAGEVASDLESWLVGGPVRARRVSNTERLWLWCRRHPAIAGLSVAVLALVLTVAIGGPLIAIRLAAAQRQERLANAASRDRLYDALLAQARASRLTSEPGRRSAGLAALRSAAEIRATPELRDEALAHRRSWIIPCRPTPRGTSSGASMSAVPPTSYSRRGTPGTWRSRLAIR